MQADGNFPIRILPSFLTSYASKMSLLLQP